MPLHGLCPIVPAGFGKADITLLQYFATMGREDELCDDEPTMHEPWPLGSFEKVDAANPWLLYCGTADSLIAVAAGPAFGAEERITGWTHWPTPSQG